MKLGMNINYYDRISVSRIALKDIKKHLRMQGDDYANLNAIQNLISNVTTFFVLIDKYYISALDSIR